MQKNIINPLALLLAIVSGSVAASGWVRVGSEYEWYHSGNDSYKRLTSYNPYLRFSYRPLNSDWTFTGRVLWKRYPYENLFGIKAGNKYYNYASSSQSALYEAYATDYIRNGNFIFRPGIGFRIIPYNSNNQYGERYERQLRFLPQFDYLIRPETRFYLNGFFYFQDALGSRENDTNDGSCSSVSMDGTKCSRKYNDWGYEFDTGVRHSFNPYNLLVAGIHTEYKGITNNYNDNLVQAVLEYQYTVGKLTLAPWAKISLTRTIKKRSEQDSSINLTQHQPYDRYGFRMVYPINGRWTTFAETYYHTEKMTFLNRKKKNVEDRDDRNKWFFNVAVQYNF